MTDAGASSRHCGLDPPVYRGENDEEQSSSALQAHTLCQHDQRLVNPEGGGRATTRQNNHHIPLSLDGRGLR